MLNNILLAVFLLALAACNGGSGTVGGPEPTPEPIPTGTTYNVSGTITYDFVPINSSRLDYASKSQKPVRNVIIQARRPSDNAVVVTGKTDDNGAFTLAIPVALPTYYIAVLSKMSSPDITVEDNTASNAVYLAQDSTRTNSGNVTLSNINLPCGWSGSNAAGSYSGTRYSAPFAILDTIYTAHKKMATARPSFSLPALKVNWSKLNYASASYNPSTGAILTSHFDGTELYILGKADADTDEFDHHVIVHEWGHFVEDKISRSDSLGGQHGTGDKLNMSVAFGEGWGNALSAIILDPEITYLDSAGPRQQSIQVSMDMEAGADVSPGWFSETSVQQLIFDVYDPANEAADTLNLGLGPIIDVLSGPQKLTNSFTSIFSFMSSLKSLNGSASGDIDNLVAAKSITPVADVFGTGETHNGGIAATLPIYNTLVEDTAVLTSLSGSNYRSNEMRNNRFFKFMATTNTTRLTLTCDNYCVIGVFKAGVWITDTATATSTIVNLSTVTGNVYTVIMTIDEDSTTTSTVNASLKANFL